MSEDDPGRDSPVPYGRTSWRDQAPGIAVSKRGLDAVLAAVDGPVVQLDGAGSPVVDLAPPPAPTFVLSDHRDFTEAEAATLEGAVDERVSLGPEAVHADHAITIAHNYLDTDGYATY